MNVRRLLCLAWLALCTSAAAAAAPAVALYYGSAATLQELRLFDIAVVEPDHGYDPVQARAQGAELYAYAAVGEALPSRPYYARIPAAWKMARNGPWQSDAIDQTPAAWPDFFATEVIAPLWQRGYRGFFLDTLDSYRLAKDFDEAAQQAGLVRVIETLHARFPGIQLILNRGFEIAERVQDKVRMVAAESLFRRWNARDQRYEQVPEADRQWLVAQLRTVHERTGLPILAIDYVPPSERALARQTAADIAALGFIPWVADAHLDTLGLGSVEPVARRVLVLYDGAEVPSLNYAAAHRFLQMPLNYLGYVADYADIRAAALPEPQRDRYAGVVTWFSGFVPDNRTTALEHWLRRRLDEGMPLLVLGSFGLALPDALAARLGIAPASPGGTERISHADAMLGFEAAPPATKGARFAWPNAAGAPAQGQALVELRDARGQALIGGALLPWGGFLVNPFVIEDIPGTDHTRWVVDPFALLRRGLHLPDIPVPDVTTENGRRLLFAHVDGDGFASMAEFPGSPPAADVLRREILEKFRIPHAASVIEAEVAPNGLYPQLSPQLEDIARRIFRLPHVEIASHTYSHPFLWDASVPHGLFKESAEAAINLEIPGYTMDLHREIVGSTEYINTRLAPPGKRVKILLWSGDTAPGAQALEITERAGLLNMNGGDTSISHNTPTLTEVGALGIVKNGYLQVYAPITNENIYTNLWHGPFYGYQNVLQTFAMTETPRRLKPVDIYYHLYSTSKPASLAALRKVYQWAMAQPLHPVFPSEYILKVRDWHTLAMARDGNGWRIRGDGQLRTLRLPPALGLPDLTRSQGVAGWHDAPQGRYVHLSAASALLFTTTAPASGQPPSLAEANARLTDWQPSADGRSLRLALRGYVPLELGLRNVQGCRIQAGGRSLRALPSTPDASVRSYRLTDAAADFQIECPAR